MTQPDTSTIALPTIIRVESEQEARYEARLHGLYPSQWRYIANRESLMGFEFREGDETTYYVHHDVSHREIEARMR